MRKVGHPAAARPANPFAQSTCASSNGACNVQPCARARVRVGRGEGDDRRGGLYRHHVSISIALHLVTTKQSYMQTHAHETSRFRRIHSRSGGINAPANIVILFRVKLLLSLNTGLVGLLLPLRTSSRCSSIPSSTSSLRNRLRHSLTGGGGNGDSFSAFFFPFFTIFIKCLDWRR